MVKSGYICCLVGCNNRIQMVWNYILFRKEVLKLNKEQSGLRLYDEWSKLNVKLFVLIKFK